jgi:hypothetical protein
MHSFIKVSAARATRGGEGEPLGKIWLARDFSDSPNCVERSSAFAE